MVTTLRKRKKVPIKDYSSALMHNNLRNKIQKVRNELQEKENKQYGKRSQKISFVYASMVFSRRIK